MHQFLFVIVSGIPTSIALGQEEWTVPKEPFMFDRKRQIAVAAITMPKRCGILERTSKAGLGIHRKD